MIHLDFSHHPKTTLAAGCPWEPLANSAPPNVKWCEESLCSWIAEPALTWSNLAYIIAGIVMIYSVRKLKSAPRDSLIRWFGPAALIVGISSFVYHASINFWTQLFDFFGMNLFCALLIFAGLRKRFPKMKRLDSTWLLIVSTSLLGFTVVMDQLRLPIQLLIFALIVVIAVMEFKPKHRLFLAAMGCFVVGGIASALDLTRFQCDPTNHWFQGHAVWHVVGALGMLLAFFHYRQDAQRI